MNYILVVLVFVNCPIVYIKGEQFIAVFNTTHVINNKNNNKASDNFIAFANIINNKKNIIR